MSKPKIILVGGGGHCASCIDVIEAEGRFEILGIVDPSGASVCGYPNLGGDEGLAELRNQSDFALVTVGQVKSAAVRIKLFHELKQLGFQLPTMISPLAHVSKHAKIDEGTIVMHLALVNANAKIGANCILNSKCLVEHDAVVGDHCHISTGAILNGKVGVGNECFVGSNATIVHEVEVPASSFIKAGERVK